MDFRDALSGSNLPILVDELDWAHVPESFQREHERGGVVVVYGRDHRSH